MNRRRLLQAFSIPAAMLVGGRSRSGGVAQGASRLSDARSSENPKTTKTVDLEGYTLLAKFKHGAADWRAYEDLRTREGPLLFVSSRNHEKLFAKTAEATTAGADIPYLGLSLEEIAGSLPDLLARRILEKGGDPDPEAVRSAVPPIEFTPGSFWRHGTFISTKECWDTQAVHYDGSTLTCFPSQYAPELLALVNGKGVLGCPGCSTSPPALGGNRVLDGLVGGWLPAIRKVFPLSDRAHWEVIIFPDVEKRERFIVHTWHRIARIEGGKMVQVFYQHTYRPYPPRRQNPKPEEFYRAFLLFAEYWEAQLRDFVPVALPQNDWVEMSKHSFVKELMTRPGGVYPKYGVLDRLYAGSEHDGFPDTFTNAVYANLEWGRFETAKSFIENYFDEFVDSQGLVNYRGPETGQYGLMLSLLARHLNYTRDNALLSKYQGKLRAIAGLLTELHDESLRLPRENPGQGLIHGWSEADSCLMSDPPRHWQPYFGNSALASRGFNDLGRAWLEIARVAANPSLEKQGQELLVRSQTLREAIAVRLESSIRRNLTPPYVGPLPGMAHTFDDDGRRDPQGPQAFSTRSYIELLQADVLPPNLSNLVVDCMLAYNGTTLGIPGGWRDIQGKNRHMLAFISYGYAQALLRLERIEEFLLFLYAHRYHCHTRGHWTAAETAGIARAPDKAQPPYCTPAQQAIPLLVRWMLVLEDSDQDRVYLAKGLPRAWLISGKDISIQQAPTRWGRINFSLRAKPETKVIVARVELPSPGAPKEFHLKLRLPAGHPAETVTVNGRTGDFSGPHRDTVIVETRNEKSFEVVAHFR